MNEKAPSTSVGGRTEVAPAQNALLDALRREVNPLLEDVDFSIVFSEHGTAEDAEGVWSQHLKQADVYLIERPLVTDDNMRYFNNLSSGVQAPQDFGFEPFFSKLDELMHASGLLVACAEVPKESEEGEKVQAYFDEWVYSREEILNKSLSYEDALEKMAEAIHSFTLLNETREKYIADHVVPVLVDAIKNSQSLRDKKHVVVRMVMGNAHTALAHRIRGHTPVGYIKYHPGVARQGYLSALVRNGLFAGAHAAVPSTQELEMALCELMLETKLGIRAHTNPKNQHEGNESKMTGLIRHIVSRLTPVEMRDLYTQSMVSVDAGRAYVGKLDDEKSLFL